MNKIENSKRKNIDFGMKIGEISPLKNKRIGKNYLKNQFYNTNDENKQTPIKWRMSPIKFTRKFYTNKNEKQ